MELHFLGSLLQAQDTPSLCRRNVLAPFVQAAKPDVVFYYFPATKGNVFPVLLMSFGWVLITYSHDRSLSDLPSYNVP